MPNDVFFEINGVRYSGFTSVTVDKSLENFATSFSASLVSKEITNEGRRDSLTPIKLQDEVAIYIDDQLVLTGYVESLSISYDAGSHSISVSGRDKVGDLIDSNLVSGNKQSYQSIRNLKKLIEKVLADNGYSDISVIQQASNIDNLEQNEKVEAEVNDTIFSFLDRYAKKVQVLLTTDAEGNIVLTREGQTETTSDLISIRGGQQNNIKSASIDLNTADRFRYIELYAQDTNDTFTKSSTNQNTIVQDTDIRSPRRLRIVLQVASQTPILKESAKWELNVRRAKGLRYNCVVANFREENDKGNIWDINKLVNVNDDKCQLNSQFLISGVRFNKSLSGSITELTIVNKGTFTTNPLSLVNNDIADPYINKSS